MTGIGPPELVIFILLAVPVALAVYLAAIRPRLKRVQEGPAT